MTGERGSNQRISRPGSMSNNDDFVRGIENIQGMVKDLLIDVRNGEIRGATLSIKFESLLEDCKKLELSQKNTDLSISEQRIKLLFLEQHLNNLSKQLDERNKEEINFKSIEKNGRWQTLTALIAAGGAIVVSIVSLVSAAH